MRLFGQSLKLNSQKFNFRLHQFSEGCADRPQSTPGSPGMHRIVPKGIMKALFRKGNVLTMPYLIVRHKVEDYERWKPVFDHDHGATRKLRGSKGGWIFRNAGNPNELVIILEWDSSENARRFADAEDLREAMQRAGVADRPDVYVLEEVERVRA